MTIKTLKDIENKNSKDLLPLRLHCKNCKITINLLNSKAIRKHEKNCNPEKERLKQEKEFTDGFKKFNRAIRRINKIKLK